MEKLPKRDRQHERAKWTTIFANHHLSVVLPAIAASTAIVATAATSIALQVKGVDIVDAGVTHNVTTVAGNVSEVLRNQGVQLGEHDIVTPALDAAVPDDGKIVIQRAKPVALVRGGKSWTSWATGRTLAQQLSSVNADAGNSGSVLGGLAGSATDANSGVYMLADRTGYLPLADKPTKVTVTYDKKTKQLTVGGYDDLQRALARAGVTLRPLDSMAVAKQADGTIMVRVERNERQNVTRTEAIPFKKVEKKSDKLERGKKEVTTKGENGTRTIIEYRETIDGRVTHSFKVSEKVTKKPVDEVTTIGTGDPEKIAEQRAADIAAGRTPEGAPAAPAAPANPTGAQAIARSMLGGMGWGDDQFGCLVQLWQRESGWNVHASNGGSGAYGIPQALPGSKMASAGADWRTNPATQIRWGLGYIAGRYGTPCGAWGHFTSVGWY